MPTTALMIVLAGGFALAQAHAGAPSGGAPQPGLAQREASEGWRPPPAGTDPSVQSRNNRNGRSALDDAYADCMRLWEPGTHMTQQEWSRTCRRIQSRLDAVQIK